MMKNTKKHITAVAVLSLGLATASESAQALDRTTSYSYNSLGLIETIDGPRLDVSDITRYGYDAQGNRISTTNALGQVTQIIAHDSANRPLSLIDPNGLTTTLAYDPRGRLIQHSRSDGTTTRTTQLGYDPIGNLTQVTQSDGSHIRYHYDDAHRLIGMEDNLGNRIDYTLDAMGNRLSEQVRDPQGVLTRSWHKTYDDLGQVRQQLDSQNHTTEYSYDLGGNLTQSIDANLNPSNQAYDALDRIVQHTDALNGVTKYGYDEQGNLTWVTDPKNLTTHYTYDKLGNLTQLTSPDTGTTNYTYDEAGNRLTRTDARNITLSYSYDALNRLTQVSYPDASLNVSYSYDQGVNGIGRLTRMSDANGETDYAYNPFGDLISQTRTSSDGIVTTYGYAYDAYGRLASLTYPSGNRVNYTYDSDGQLARLDYEWSDGTTQTLISNLQKLPFGPLKSFDYGNGLTLTRNFDQNYRLTDQSIPGILHSGYQYDPVGNITAWQDLIDTGRDQQFGYDVLDRLTAAIGEYGSLSYTYDAIGNRLRETEDGTTERYSYVPGSNRLSQFYDKVADMRSYDAAGNTIQGLIGSYTYDDTSRLVGFTRTGITAGYAYNGKGERIRKTVNGAITRFRYDPTGQLLGEYDQNGQVIREYIILAGQPVAMLDNKAIPQRVDFEQTTILSYGGAAQDVASTVEVDGGSMKLSGNGWKKIAFPYTITPNTVLEFDYQSTQEGEIQGIGFETDDNLSSGLVFQLFGTQTWGIQGVAEYPGKGTVHMVIPVGQYYTGEMQWMTFANDHDRFYPKGDGRYSNVRVYEANEQLNTSPEIVYLHTDHLGTVVKATDSTQALVWDVERKPFGKRVMVAERIRMPLGFAGQYYDQESNNYYNYFRDYDPGTGRYLQSDPIGLNGGPNTYAYVRGNPISYIDPLGLEPNQTCVAACTVGGGIIGGAAGYIGGGVGGGVAGGLGGTVFGPGGTIVGAGAGASAGSSYLGAAGAAAGSAAGYGVGQALCPDDEDECDMEFLREIYYGGDTKSCVYRGKGNMFTFPQDKELPCMPINRERCLVDTSFMGPKARSAYGGGR